MPAETPPPPPDIDYAARWRQIVERRRVQMEAAYARSGQQNVDYWGRRAKSYRDALHDRTELDPFIVRVESDITPESTVLDVGAGTGRHTLQLAPRVSQVTAVDPSEAMLSLLRQDAEARGLQNVRVVQSDWMTADVEPHEIVICSHVLYPIADVVPFIEKLEAYATARVYVALRVDPLPTDLGLWSEFYGEPLQLQPVYADLVNVMMEAGIVPDAQITEHRFTWTFAGLDEAVAATRNTLCLREDDEAASARLRTLLEERLVEWPGGRLGPHIDAARTAIISWQPRQISAQATAT